jgi:hypothetical protein
MYSTKKRTPKWGFIDNTGRFVINPEYSHVGYFNNGVAQVSVGEGDGQKFGYIDKTGKFIFAPSK